MQASLKHTESDGSLVHNREDVAARVRFIKEHAGLLGVPPPPSRCMDPMVLRQQLGPDSLMAMLQGVAPCCCGDSLVDFRRCVCGGVPIMRGE